MGTPDSGIPSWRGGLRPIFVENRDFLKVAGIDPGSSRNHLRVIWKLFGHSRMCLVEFQRFFIVAKIEPELNPAFLKS